MSILFCVDRTGISRNINNIYREKELEKRNTCANFAHVGENNKKQSYEIKFYNLDVIISVGYRVKSKNGIIFRRWANSILKDYMLKGYAVNQRRLKYLEKTVQLIDIAGRIDTKLNGEEFKDIIKVINNYKDALNLLDEYDHKNLIKPNGTFNKNKRIIITKSKIYSKITIKFLKEEGNLTVTNCHQLKLI